MNENENKSKIKQYSENTIKTFHQIKKLKNVEHTAQISTVYFAKISDRAI